MVEEEWAHWLFLFSSVIKILLLLASSIDSCSPTTLFVSNTPHSSLCQTKIFLLVVQVALAAFALVRSTLASSAPPYTAIALLRIEHLILGLLHSEALHLGFQPSWRYGA